MGSAHLGRDNPIRSAISKLLQDTANLLLGLALGVAFGSVDHIDTVLEGKLDYFSDRVALNNVPERKPCTKGKDGDAEPRVS